MRLRLKRKIDNYFGCAGLAILIPAAKLFGWLLNRDHSLRKEPKTILVIKLMGLGSLFASLSAIKAIQEHFPKAKLILITDERLAEGLIPIKAFDEILNVRTNSLFLLIIDSFKHLNYLWQCKSLWVIDIEVYSKLTTIFSLLTCSLNRFGFYLKPAFFRKYLNTHNIHFNQFNYLEDNYLKVAETVIQKAKIQVGQSELKKNKSFQSRRIIAVNNTCSELSNLRKMPDELLKHLCNWLLQNTYCEINILGAPEDALNNEEFISKYFSFATHRIKNIAGQYKFAQLYTLLKEDVFCVITIDSAPLHIAKYFRIPTFSIWGPTNPLHYLKHSEAEKKYHSYYYLKASCSPCVHHFETPPCEGNNVCMKSIRADDISERLKSYLETLSTLMQVSLMYKNQGPDFYQINR